MCGKNARGAEPCSVARAFRANPCVGNVTAAGTTQPEARFVVLLAGPSASGKTTVARLLAKETGAQLLCLDDHFRRRPKIMVAGPNGPVRTYERPELYDGAALAATAGQGPAILEGFCLFAYPEVLALSPHRFYLDLPFELSRARRAARIPLRRSDQSYQLIGRQEYEAFVASQRQIAGVRILDAQQPPELLAAAIRDDIAARFGGG